MKRGIIMLSVLSAVLFIVVALMGCVSGTGDLKSITVTPGNPVIKGAGTQQFKASAKWQNGSTSDVTNTGDVTWSSSDNTIATIDQSGLATGINAGTVTITAASKSDGNIKGTATLKVSSDSTLTFTVGTNPTAVALDSSGNAWVTNFSDNTVNKVNPNGTVTGPFSVGKNPRGIAIDSSGNIWVTNQGDGTVTKLNSSGTGQTAFAIGGSPYGIAIDHSGNVWITNYGTLAAPGHTVTELKPGGELAATFTVENNPAGIAIDSSGNVWVANFGSNSVSEITSSGTVLPSVTVGMSPHGIAIDSSNNIWVTSFAGNNVIKLDSSGKKQLTSDAVTGPYGIAASSGKVYVTNYVVTGTSVDTVTRLDSSGKVILPPLTVGNNPAGIAIDASGNVWVTNFGGGNVTLILTGG